MIRKSKATIGLLVNVAQIGVGRIESINGGLVVVCRWNGEAIPAVPFANLSIEEYEDRQRFNWGYHDGVDDSAHPTRPLRDLVNHFDDVYTIGYVYGVSAQRRGGDTSLSAIAWADACKERDGRGNTFAEWIRLTARVLADAARS